MADETHPVDHGPEHHEGGGHASLRTYIVIGVILTVVTAIEVAIFYIPALAGVLIPTLLALSLGKFMLVVLFYMHLKFDSRIFWRVFFGPLVLALLVVVGLIVFMNVLADYRV
jgi:cytochrome c oxidase subunit IV